MGVNGVSLYTFLSSQSSPLETEVELIKKNKVNCWKFLRAFTAF
nr:MAG TPA: hypothetical protein [Caudoviricetes sp.]